MSGGGDVADADIAYRQHVSMCIARLANYLVLWQIELSCSLATCRELASLLVRRFIMSGDGMPSRRFYSPENVSRSWQVKWWMVLSAYSCGQPSFCVISPDEKPRTWYETTSCSRVSSLLILFSSSGIEIEVNSSGLSFAGIISSLIRVVFLYRSVVCLTIKTKERGKLFPRNEKSVARAGCCRRFLRGYFMNTKYTAAMRHTKAAR